MTMEVNISFLLRSPCLPPQRLHFILAAVAMLVAATIAQKTKYIIGGWVPGSPDEIIGQLKPIFETYLNEEVGMTHRPPLRFEFIPADYSTESYSDASIESGNIDFVYSLAGRVACIQVDHGWIPIATQRVWVNGVESGAQGSLLYSLKENTKIRNISDFKGKKIGVGYMLSSNSYHLGYKLLKSNGVDLYSDVDQFILYGNDYEAQFKAVVNGHIDGGMLPSTWLLQKHPEQLGVLLIHNPMQVHYEAELFPFPTSTDVVPQPGLMASPGIPWRLKLEIANALIRLNRSHPATWEAGISGFTVPGSYAFARSLMEDLGILNSDPEGGHCITPFDDALSTITCQHNFVRQRPPAAALQCYKNGLECPPGDYPCLCHPCIPDLQVEIFTGKVVLGLSCTLFVLGLTISACWIIPVESYYLLAFVARAAGRLARRASDAYIRPRHQPHGGGGAAAGRRSRVLSP